MTLLWLFWVSAGPMAWHTTAFSGSSVEQCLVNFAGLSNCYAMVKALSQHLPLQPDNLAWGLTNMKQQFKLLHVGIQLYLEDINLNLGREAGYYHSGFLYPLQVNAGRVNAS
jgi:hypothetical protein